MQKDDLQVTTHPGLQDCDREPEWLKLAGRHKPRYARSDNNNMPWFETNFRQFFVDSKVDISVPL